MAASSSPVALRILGAVRTSEQDPVSENKKEEKNKCGGQWTFLFSLKTLAIFLLHHVPNQVLIPFYLVLGVVNFVFFVGDPYFIHLS